MNGGIFDGMNGIYGMGFERGLREDGIPAFPPHGSVTHRYKI